MSTLAGALSNENITASNRVQKFARRAIWALPVWAAMLFLSTLTHQPDPQTEMASFAAYVTTTTFLLSHLINSIAGAAIGSIGVIALMLHLQDSRVAGKAITGMAATVAGNTLTASVFGAAAFAQTAIGHAYQAGEQNVLTFYNLVYSAPLFITVIIGLLFFMVGGAFAGSAITGSGRYPRWTGWAYAIALIFFPIPLLPLQTPMSALLFLATVVVAWKSRQESSES